MSGPKLLDLLLRGLQSTASTNRSVHIGNDANHSVITTGDQVTINVGGPDDAASPRELGGRWQATDGLEYDLTQTGNTVHFRGFHPVSGTYSQGQGQLTGRRLSVNYQTAHGSYGSGTLQVSADGRQLSGQVVDQVSGTPLVMKLVRA